MGSAWLAISGPGAGQRAELFAQAAKWVPFAGATEHAAAAPRADIELRAWTLADEATGGCAFTSNSGKSGASSESSEFSAFSFDGWVALDPETMPSEPVADRVLSLIQRTGHADAAALDGQFSWCHLRGNRASAAAGMLQGLHVYVAQGDGVAAISNRALLAAAVVHDGQPTLDPTHMGWLLTGVACPFGTQTCWRNVELLEDGEIVSIAAGRVERRRWTAAQPRPEPPDWDALADGLSRRVAAVRNFPDSYVQMALTGGKDSRLVLAAAHNAGVLDRIDRFYLKAVAKHPDAQVAVLLARKFGRQVQLLPPSQSELDLFEAVRAHLFCAEAALGPWDHKAAANREAIVGIHGNYGEIFKSHIRPSFLLGWPMARRYYAGKWLNPNDLLLPETVDHYRQTFADWVQRCRDERTPLSDLHDRWHREARMGRWLGQTLQFDAAALPAVNPLPSRRLLRAYLSLPWQDRRDHRVHFELMRRLHPDLWQLPFANDRWKARLLRGHPGAQPPITGNVLAVSPQLQVWNRQQAEICDYLLENSASAGFFDIVSRRALAKHLTKTRAKPTWRLLEPVYALVGIRMAMTERVTAHPFALTPAPNQGSN